MHAAFQQRQQSATMPEISTVSEQIKDFTRKLLSVEEGGGGHQKTHANVVYSAR